MIQHIPLIPSARPFSARRRQSHALSGHYAALARRLWALGDGGAELPQVIGVTSCQPGEGVSTVAANLAVSVAETADEPAVLIDGHAARPAVSRMFRLKHRPGLTDLLEGEAELADCVQTTQIKNFAAITAGNRPPQIGGRLQLAKAAEIFEILKTRFKLVVVDLPTANELSSCFLLAGSLDGVLLVVEAERVERHAAVRVKQQLIDARAKLLGVVFNKRKAPTTMF